MTHQNRQYVAFYDADRRMTVAARHLGTDAWEYQVLPSRVGWDSHNGVVMAVDQAGHVHLSGNMHNDPLVYFRTMAPQDISTFKQFSRMTGDLEKRVTYPHFFNGPEDELIFHYRDGGSGNGRRLFNVYDVEQKSWRRLIDTPLLDGLGRMNAYPSGPHKGPDGFYHLVWMWRNTPDCRSNHDISHARSRDLRNWETISGIPLDLPITPDDRRTVVDPVPPNRGLINMGYGLGFDLQDRPVIHYHKYDDAGNSQLYNARWENGAWRRQQLTDWHVR